MIKYRYADQFQPPAPFVNVSARCPTTGKQLTALPALVDSAADRTVLPRRVIEALGLVEDGRLLFQGFAGDVVDLPTFLTEIRVHDLPPLPIRTVLGEREACILLGRDVLNVYQMLLDGPVLAVEIVAPVSNSI